MNILKNSICNHVLLLNLIENNEDKFKFNMTSIINNKLILNDIKNLIEYLKDEECELIYNFFNIKLFGLSHSLYTLCFNENETKFILSLINYFKIKYTNEEEDIIIIGNLPMI